MRNKKARKNTGLKGEIRSAVDFQRDESVAIRLSRDLISLSSLPVSLLLSFSLPLTPIGKFSENKIRGA